MLMHTHRDSEGSAAPFVNITGRVITNARDSGTCHSGIRIGASGALFKIQANGSFSAISGEWLPVGTASNFFVQHTITSGTLEADPAEATWNQLNVNRDYDNQRSALGFKTTQVFFEFSDDVSGTPVVATATFDFESEQGTA